MIWSYKCQEVVLVCVWGTEIELSSHYIRCLQSRCNCLQSCFVAVPLGLPTASAPARWYRPAGMHPAGLVAIASSMEIVIWSYECQELDHHQKLIKCLRWTAPPVPAPGQLWVWTVIQTMALEMSSHAHLTSCRLQLKRGLFSYLFRHVVQKLHKCIWFLIDSN